MSTKQPPSVSYKRGKGRAITHELGQLERTRYLRLCDVFHLLLVHVQPLRANHTEPNRCLRPESGRCGTRSRGGGEVWGRGGERWGGYEGLLEGH